MKNICTNMYNYIYIYIYIKLEEEKPQTTQKPENIYNTARHLYPLIPSHTDLIP